MRHRTAFFLGLIAAAEILPAALGPGASPNSGSGTQIVEEEWPALGFRKRWGRPGIPAGPWPWTKSWPS